MTKHDYILELRAFSAQLESARHLERRVEKLTDMEYLLERDSLLERLRRFPEELANYHTLRSTTILSKGGCC
jgi:hypothetical protein